MAKDDLEAYRTFARPYFAGEDVAHDFAHIDRMLGRIDALAAGFEPPPRREVLFFLVCFHGLGGKVASDATFRPAVEEFLKGLGWANEEMEDLFLGMIRHLTNPGTTEERIVHDANYLEILGAFGVAKAFTVGGARGQTYSETVDIYEKEYLDGVEFRTPAGRRLAVEGRDYARAFLSRLKQELG